MTPISLQPEISAAALTICVILNKLPMGVFPEYLHSFFFGQNSTEGS